MEPSRNDSIAAGLAARHGRHLEGGDREALGARIERALGHARAAGLHGDDEILAYAELFLHLGAGFEDREPARGLLGTATGRFGARLCRARDALVGPAPAISAYNRSRGMPR